MSIFAKNIKNSIDLTVDNLQINGSVNLPINSVDGSVIIDNTINPSKLIPAGITVNNLSKIIPIVGSIVDTNTNEQVIQVNKQFALGCKADINNGYFSVRADVTDTNYLHTISYDPTTACVFINGSDTNAVTTGLLVGCKSTNVKTNPTINKFKVSYLGSQVNSTSIELENIEFLNMNSTPDNRFKLKSIDSISIGSTLTNQGSLFINKTGNAEINLVSTGSTAAVQLTGLDNEIKFGPAFKINNNVSNPQILRIYKSPTISMMDFNYDSECVSVGNNNGSTALNYMVFNAGVNNKILKIPNMTTAQQNAYLLAISGTSYQGSVFFNYQTNRLCFTDSNNILHQVSGTTAITGNDPTFVLESTITPGKLATLIIDESQLVQNNNVYMPLNSDVHLKYLEGMSGTSIQTQINNKSNTSDVVLLNTDQTITSLKTFESAINNSNNIAIKNTTSNNCSISFENAFSVSKTRIRKFNDDISFEYANIERAKISGNNFELTNGGDYFINGVNLKNVSEALTNKTIAFGSNNLTNVCSTNTDQSITGVKNYSTNAKLLVNSQSVHKLRNSTTSDPGVSNDNTQGYEEGSLWFNSTSKSRWIADSVATGVAKWTNTNHRSITHSPFISTTIGSYLPYVFITAGYTYFNNCSVIYFTDGTIQIEAYNVSTGLVIANSAIVSAGPAVVNFVLGTALSFPINTTIRFSVKLITGTTCTIYTSTVD